VKSTPSQRFRIEQWVPYLQDQGISVDFFPFADEELMKILHNPGKRLVKTVSLLSAFLRSAALLRMIGQYHVVLIHRNISIAGPAVLERLVTLFRRPVVFDFDDAIFQLHTSDANRWFGWLKFPGKTATICRLSTHITVGNSFLADYARQYNANVSVVPTSVDTDRYRPVRKHTERKRIVVGWTGSSTSQTHLELFAPILRTLLGRRNVELRLISNRQPDMKDIACSWHPWSPETETEELAAFDIGIMPVPDDPWARGKCALKALQYMAMGIPTVCSPVGTNTEVIQHGTNGFLAATPEDWLLHLETLIDDVDLRRHLGMAGRRTVEQKYSMRSSAELFGDVIRTAGNTLATTQSLP
jgi:glycosyltransferase involved in cell wall biosynthesis